MPGSLGLDLLPWTQADIIHDLNQFPYPFPDSTFEGVHADNVLEHLERPIRVMEEIHRITKPGARIEIIVPYFRSKYAFTDPTHRTFFGIDSFAYFDPTHPTSQQYPYTQARFAIEKRVFNEGMTFTGPMRFLIHAVTRFANRWPQRYEYFLGHLFPLDQLTFVLRTIK
ncbi:MAG: hypothetical protein OZSIB_1319 [Candidatus Ozemobacter sibiricus]|uniref:Methyltransferase type 11 domain-containing protein n=1 Tax=Candidatus Ozemobacter sibiricus TaxID=2268124 RepID=A0A367ZL68_9BACT|nr:MAG: hypothetical protein OZSIB_1319 [Candidatus Ozemobacter sibiricus]